MLRRFAFLLVLFASPAGARPADPPVPVASPAPVDPTVPPTELVFADLANRMTVPVALGEAGPFAFIVDTGAQRTVVSRELANRMRFAPGRDIRLLAMSGVSTVGTVLVPSVKVSVLSAERVEAPALDAYNMGALGILGIDTLQRHAVTIDFERNVMGIIPAARRPQRTTHLPGEILVTAKSQFGQLVVTDAFIGPTRVRVVIDTGTSVSIGNEALRRRVMRQHRGRPIIVTSVTGGQLNADFDAVPQITIGSLGIANLPMAFADIAVFKSFGLQDKPAILLGMDALKIFSKVSIDFPNRQVRFLLPAGSTHHAPNDYSFRIEAQR